MHIEECLCCNKQYDTQQSSASKPILYCSQYCEQSRQLELLTEFGEEQEVFAF